LGDRKAETACFTGHREMKMATGEVKRRLSELLDILISRGVLFYGCGGAWGFDFLAAEMVIEKKKTNPAVKLILVLPCKDQDKGWRPEQQATYAYIKTQADKTVYTAEKYFRGCMHKRNRHLVDNSKFCISLLEKHQGGTYYTFQYAMDKGLTIYNLSDVNWRKPIEHGFDL